MYERECENIYLKILGQRFLSHFLSEQLHSRAGGIGVLHHAHFQIQQRLAGEITVQHKDTGQYSVCGENIQQKRERKT